jgi:penicillin-binding protein 1A
VRIRKLRVFALLLGLGALAAVSTVFGMMMAVASDLPAIDVLDVAPRSSVIVDRDGEPLGVLTGNENRILVRSDEIAPVMKQAIVSIEDRRFYTNSGVDLRAIGRAAVQDVLSGSAAQGGSTIAQQLVKNRLEAQDDRSIFQKLREAAMAFHMTRKWDKERILRNYLNTIYFGNGAYGIEAAARTYFGSEFRPRRQRARSADPRRPRSAAPSCSIRPRRRCWRRRGQSERLRPPSRTPWSPSSAATWSCCGCSSRAT